jgi:hypothetical protein
MEVGGQIHPLPNILRQQIVWQRIACKSAQPVCLEIFQTFRNLY